MLLPVQAPDVRPLALFGPTSNPTYSDANDSRLPVPPSPPRAVPRAVRRYAPNPLIKQTSVPISEAEIEIAFEPLVALGWTIDVEPPCSQKDTAIRTALTRTLRIEDLRQGQQPTADPASEKDDFRQRSAKLVSVLAEIFMVHKVNPVQKDIIAP